jgi:excinuclease ABC subunit C
MPISDLKARIARLPEQPGVYLFENAAGETIYVGKARSLRDRVRSYLGAYGSSPKIDALLEDAANVATIVTDSVVEALALENHLIKQRWPKYNILLRDDKNYPYLQLTTGEAFPRVLVARHVERDGHYYAGPFMPASLARRTMSLTHRLFGIRSCNEVITGERPRPCLEFDIKRCIAPCVSEICPPEEYQRAVGDTRLFLEGRNEELIEQLLARMQEAAQTERFEQAAQLRDAIRTLETLRDRQQKIATTELGDRDAFGLKIGPAGATIQVFQVRHGRVIERVELVTDAADIQALPSVAAAGAEGVARGTRAGVGPHAQLQEASRFLGDVAIERELVETALQQFYEGRVPPPEVHVPMLPEESEAIEAWLSDRAGRRVRLVVPRRGEKRGLLDLATRNASLAYRARFERGDLAFAEALETLQLVIDLPALPRRIECFDISTIQGSETVASMVVCEDGRMKRSDYRKFKVRGSAHDDFAAMHEVVMRRYRRLLESGGPFPDLVVIDGGKGQLAAAYTAFGELGLSNLVAIGIAKKEELIFTREHEDAIKLPDNSPALLLLQRIRDEAHRFAVTFHRQSRTKRDLASALDVIPGIGPRRRRALLTKFGSLAGVRRATREELVAAVGRRAADAVLAYFATA